MGKQKNEYIKLQQILENNAKIKKHNLDAAHWESVAKMMQPLIDAETPPTINDLDNLFRCADEDD